MASHERNLGPMRSAPRCGARTRAGTPCQAPGIAGKTRCRMHGGKGSGAPRDNQNAQRHGRYNKAMRAREKYVRDPLPADPGGNLRTRSRSGLRTHRVGSTFSRGQ